MKEPKKAPCQFVWVLRTTDNREGLGCMGYVRSHRAIVGHGNHKVIIRPVRKVTPEQAKMLLQVSGDDLSGALWSCLSDCRLYKLRSE